MKRRPMNVSEVVKALKAQANDPAKRGQKASAYVVFGDYSRYAIYAVHTRFEAVQYFVVDVEQLNDEDGKEYGRIIRQEDTVELALADLID
jgi:hypothetical protein